MSEEKKITIKSNVGGRVVILIPSMHKKLEFPQKGTKRIITQEMLDEMIYDVGVENMLKDGTISIENEDVKQEIGYGADLVELNDTLLKRMFSVMPIAELKETLKKMTSTQLREVAEYVVENNKSMTMERISIMQEISKYDIEAALRLKRQNEEPLPNKEG